MHAGKSFHPPLGINDINKEANSNTTQGEKPICVDRNDFNV